MSRRLSDWRHLIRLGGLLLAAGLAFAFIRPYFIPATFGDLGHYRAAAVGEAAARPLVFGDGATCAVCHSEIEEARVSARSRHAAIACQSCHGPLARHIDAPDQVKPVLPEVVALCTRCHAAMAGRPARVPQVIPDEHSGGERCTTCHSPHTPGMG